MVVLDSSALIPLARVGRLDLITALFTDLATTHQVKTEVVVTGKPGTEALKEFLKTVSICDVPDEVEEVAALEGVAVADASVVLLAEHRGAPLLANDKALIEIARSHGVECWWVTTVVLSCVKRGILPADEANDILYDLVVAGMNLSPQVYAQIHRRIEELGS